MSFRTRAIIACSAAAMAAVAITAPLAVGGTAQAAAKAAATTPACTAAELGVWVAADFSQGAAGTAYYPLEFTNVSQQTCTLDGHPGVSATSDTGQQFGSSASWLSGTPGTVTLAPKATAHATLVYSDATVGSCPPASLRTPSFLQVYPPGQTQADHAYWDEHACIASPLTHFLAVQVIKPGLGLPPPSRPGQAAT